MIGIWSLRNLVIIKTVLLSVHSHSTMRNTLKQRRNSCKANHNPKALASYQFSSVTPLQTTKISMLVSLSLHAKAMAWWWAQKWATLRDLNFTHWHYKEWPNWLQILPNLFKKQVEKKAVSKNFIQKMVVIRDAFHQNLCRSSRIKLLEIYPKRPKWIRLLCHCFLKLWASVQSRNQPSPSNSLQTIWRRTIQTNVVTDPRLRS